MLANDLHQLHEIINSEDSFLTVRETLDQELIRIAIVIFTFSFISVLFLGTDHFESIEEEDLLVQVDSKGICDA